MATNKFTLQIVKGSKDTPSFVFSQKTIHIGSLYALNDLVLNMEGISVRHARIRRNKDDFDILNTSDRPFVIGEGISLESRKTLKVQAGTDVNMGAITIRLIHDQAPGVPGRGKRTRMPKQPRPERHVLSLDGPWAKRAAGIGGVAVLLFVVAIMAGNCARKEGQSHDRPLSYPAVSSQEPVGLPAKGIYGYTRDNDKDHPDKAVFTFETDASNVELYYTAGGIDSEKELSILLNDQLIGYAPMAKGVWGSETVLRLPAKALKKDEANFLVFDNRENPPQLKQWAVRNIRISSLAENLCDLDRAEKLIRLGREMYAQKDISKGNLFRAHRYYRDAVSLMQDCDNKKESYRQAEQRQAQTGRELDVLHHDLSFAFQKAYKMNDYDQCLSILQNIVLYFPDPLDKRHKEAADILETYARD